MQRGLYCFALVALILLSFIPLKNAMINGGGEQLISVIWRFYGGNVSSNYVIGDIDGDGGLEVVFGTWEGYLYALDVEDGEVLWSVPIRVTMYPALGDIDGDGRLEVLVSGTKGNDSGIYVFNGEDGSLLWKFIAQYPFAFFSPSIGDLDLDGKPEVIFSSTEGSVYALNGEDGSLVWKVLFNTVVGVNIALGDIDNDGKLECVFGSFDGFVYALNGESGSLLWCFNTTRRWVGYSVSIGDVNVDGRLEVIAGTWGDYDYSFVFALNGTSGCPLWKFRFYSAVSISIPAIVDLNGDRIPETVFGALDGYIYCLRGVDGVLVWRTYTDPLPSEEVTVGDINGDNRLDVLTTSFVGELIALDGTSGSILWKYPINSTLWPANLADLDGNGDLEIIVGGRNGLCALDVANSGFRIYWQGGGGDLSFMRKSNQVFIDRDMDFLSDYSELHLGTNLANNDTDGDGMGDGWEVYYGFDPTNASDAELDVDGDGLSNLGEYLYGTNPTSNDTDGDGTPDLWEIKYDLNPTDPSDASLDCDSDGLSNLAEFNMGTDPTNPDSDGDLFGDGIEVAIGSDPLNPAMPWLFIVSFTIAVIATTIYLRKRRSSTEK